MQRTRIAIALAWAVSMCFGAVPGSQMDVLAAERVVPQTSTDIRLSYAPLVKKVAPAVVNIYARKIVKQRGPSLFNDPFFQRFFGRDFGKGLGPPARERIQNSLGSGVIIDSNGTVVTNNHVINDADEIRVVLADRREFNAEVIGRDERTDLAILRLQDVTGPLAFLEFSDSDKAEVGDLVLAIGDPFGVGQTVTSGIISGVARTQVGKSDLQGFIQTDAAINPGNSGGALVDMGGKIVGINTVIFSKSGGSHGVGFAIPSNMVRAVSTAIIKTGRPIRPWVGAEGQTVTAEIAASIGMTVPTGVLINRVHKNSPADEAGLRVGDLVVTVNHHVVDDVQALRFRLATLPLDGKVPLEVLRSGRKMTFDVSLVAPPGIPLRNVTEIDGKNPFSGVVMANMSPALADELSMDGFEPGVVVLKLRRGSVAHRLGFETGDVVLKVNGGDIAEISELKAAIDADPANWRIVLRRDGQIVETTINQ
jgi:Do/DeqQ family serine protease